MSSICRTYIFATVVFAAASPAALFADAVEKPTRNSLVRSKEISSFLQRHCSDCHAQGAAEGDFELESLPAEVDGFGGLQVWQLVLDRIEQQEMPPADAEQPTAEQRAALIRDLTQTLTEADRWRQQTAGRTPLRRLNRVEYENTLRDLFARPHLRIAQMLPPDPEAGGFDNVAEALRISYVHMNRYLDTAGEALRKAAWIGPPPVDYEFRLQFKDIHRFRSTYDRITVGDEAVLLRQPNTAQTPWRVNAIEIPFAGTHTIRIRGRAVTYTQDNAVPEGVNKTRTTDNHTDHGKLLPPESPQIVSVYQGTRWIGAFDLTAESSVNEVMAHLYPRETIYLYVPTLDDRNPQWKKGPYTDQAVALDWIEVAGPADVSWPTPANRVLFGDLPIVEWSEDSDVAPPDEFGEPKHPKHHPKLDLPHKKTRYMVASQEPIEDARRLLKNFIQRAIRRPLPEGEVERYMDVVRERLDANKPFHTALFEGYRAVLCSPDFLFYREKPGELDAYALASRLSYFLWKSMPDEELRRLADSGDLREPDVLARQVERMLGDPKAERFIEDFTGQWLDLHEINFTQPDDKLYPKYDEFVKESMVAETHAYFRKMLAEDLPARHVVDSDFAIVNNTLAQLYDIEDVDTVELREVKLPADSPRGGLLTQGAILKVTANGTTTSPVTRGAWVLEHILGTPPAPPPPNVPAIEPDTRGATTIRELLVKHRADPACAGCHAKIDPPGFALESFDVIGGWRQRYRSIDEGENPEVKVRGQNVHYKLGPPVDASGHTPDGQSFGDIQAFKEILLDDERQVARNLTERLVTYATGAEPSLADREVIEHILDEAAPSGYGLRTLIHEIVQSRLFRHK